MAELLLVWISKLVLPSEKVSMIPDDGFAEAIGMEAKILNTIIIARVMECTELDVSGFREWLMLYRTISGG